MRIKQIIFNIAVVLALAMAGGLAASVPSYAAPPAHGHTPAPTPAATPAPSSTCPSTSTSKGQVLQGLGQTGSDCSDTQVNETLKTVITILSIVVGVASVIVIILSGFKYIVSGGEQGKVANAKNSLLYALVGVAVAALAQLMIHFVLFNTNK